jgi:XTP/dITP diphosphohydrolase
VTLPPQWVLATGNRGKVVELEALFAEAGLAIRLTAQSELGVTSPPETGVTFVENALLKARHAARVTKLPAIADDSGLVVDALGGAPGVRSARFAGEDSDDRANVAKLLELLTPPSLARGARFHCVLVASSIRTTRRP